MLAALFRSRIRLLCQPLWLGIALLAAACFQGGCAHPNPDQAEGKSAAAAPAAEPGLFKVAPDQLPHLKIAKVAKTSWPVAIHTTGTVDWDADHTTQAITQVNGPISRLLVDTGAQVAKGQPLLFVSSPDVAAAMSAYRKARNREVLNKRIVDRVKDLLEHGSVAQKDYESAEADYNDASTDVQTSLQVLKIFGITATEIEQAERQGTAISTELAVRSPIAGTVVQKLVSPGMVIQAGSTVCFMISAVSEVWVQGHIFDRDLPSVRVGDPVELTNPSFDGVRHGKVAYIGAFVDPATRTTPVRIVTENPRGILKKDMFVEAVIHTSTRSNILVVPLSAVLRDDNNEPLVYVQARPGEFAQRPVRTGAEQSGFVAVASGLTEGEEIVTDGSLFLQFANRMQ
jgi:cobalt-zinc-cadmium efflux system membrane fusion protein